jgi:hypothetical protein
VIDQVFRRLKAGLRYLNNLPASHGLADTMFRPQRERYALGFHLLPAAEQLIAFITG